MILSVKETGVIELYYENMKEKIVKKYEEKERKIIKKDPIFAQLSAFKEQMKDIKDLKITYDYKFPREIVVEIDALCDKREHEINSLLEFIKEVGVLYEACETYEQKQAILKAYNIIDEQGKLIK